VFFYFKLLFLPLFDSDRQERRGGGRDKETERQRQADRERDRETERQRERDRERDRETERETERDRETERQRQRETERQRDRERDRQRGKETDRETEREREREPAAKVSGSIFTIFILNVIEFCLFSSARDKLYAIEVETTVTATRSPQCLPYVF